MHAKSGLRVLLEWKINRPDSVITAIIPLKFSKVPAIETGYANTDFDLKSASSFDTLHNELSSGCLVLHYECGDDGHYHASYESDHDGESTESGAERDILLIISLLNSLSQAWPNVSWNLATFVNST